MSEKRIAIIGASNKRERYANKAVRAYRDAGFTVYPVHPQEKEVEGLRVYKSVLDISEQIDEVSLYIPAAAGMQIIEQIAQKGIKKVYFNPGTESDELVAKAKQRGIDPLLTCSILALGKNPGDYV